MTWSVQTFFFSLSPEIWLRFTVDLNQVVLKISNARQSIGKINRAINNRELLCAYAEASVDKCVIAFESSRMFSWKWIGKKDVNSVCGHYNRVWSFPDDQLICYLNLLSRKTKCCACIYFYISMVTFVVRHVPIAQHRECWDSHKTDQSIRVSFNYLQACQLILNVFFYMVIDMWVLNWPKYSFQLSKLWLASSTKQFE